jgi:hypothetical protein
MDKFDNFLTSYIPPAGTQARLLLEILIDGLSRNTIELTILLKANPRSALQSLARQYSWLIHNEGNLNGRYRLDSRHLSKDEKLDREARVEAELMYKTRSLGLSKREAARLPKAEIDLILAEKKAESNQDELDL